MRDLLYILSALGVIGLAFWAYRENYETQDALSENQRLQQEIALSRERLRMLNAEWAYLNRPDRLRDLVEINFGKLGLLPLSPSQFGNLEQVGYPRENPLGVSLDESIEVMQVDGITDVSADEEAQQP